MAGVVREVEILSGVPALAGRPAWQKDIMAGVVRHVEILGGVLALAGRPAWEKGHPQRTMTTRPLSCTSDAISRRRP